MRRAISRTRWVAVLAVGALVVAGAGACSSGPPAPGAAAGVLAAGLAAGDLADVALTGATATEATKQLSTAVAGLKPMHPAVTVGKVILDKKGATATAALGYTWDLDAPGKNWTYTTTAHLTLVKDRWHVKWTPFLIAPDLLAGETLSLRRAAAPRASVLGAGGAALVEPRSVLRLGVDKTTVDATGQDGSARAVATLLALDPDAFAKRVAASGPKAFVEALVVRTDAPGVDLNAFAQIAGARSVSGTMSLAPSRRFARAILGTSGPATAEIIDKSDGKIFSGDLTGLSGLQRQYDKQLRGSAGLTVVVKSADGAAARDVFELAAASGESLVTTIEPALQDAAETILEPIVPASAIVAIRPSTGQVLAAASGPGGAGYSTATLGTYAPGSVFKVISSLALLRSGLTPDTAVTCPLSIDVDGRTFSNFPGYPPAANGSITLQTAVANSCNTAFIGARDQAPQSGLVTAAASLGLGLDADLGYPAYLGTVPGEATGTEHAASMIGQGSIQVSPLAMATVAASVASGHTVVPWLVGSNAPKVSAPAVPLTSQETTSLRTMMRAVVTEGGAGFLKDVPAPEVYAKTGTAQHGTGADLGNHAWMIAIHGDLAVAVFVADGEYGSTTAGPLLKAFLAAAG